MKSRENNVFCIGLNHDTASLELRGKVSFDPNQLGAVAERLLRSAALSEAVVLSTCNRTELYFVGDASKSAINWLAEESKLSIQDISRSLYQHSGTDVFSHLSRVACGIDSMVLGETQIFGQIKNAFFLAQNSGAVGPTLNKLFQMVFAATKEVRTETAIGAQSVSLASAIIRVSGRIFEEPHKKSVLLIGAGEMIRLCAEHFKAKSFSKLGIANRSMANAMKLADIFKASAHDLSLLPKILGSYDIVVSCTGSPLPLIGKGMAEKALVLRRNRPMAIFDLAVPRDVEEEVSHLSDIFLFTIDDLGGIVREGISGRTRAIAAAESIVDDRAIKFNEWWNARGATDSIRKLRKFGEDLVENEVQKSLDELNAGGEPEDIIRRLGFSIGNKLLDRPSRVFNAAFPDEKKEIAKYLNKLFNLD